MLSLCKNLFVSCPTFSISASSADPAPGYGNPRAGVHPRNYQFNCDVCTPSQKLAYRFMLNYIALQSKIWLPPSDKFTARYTHANVQKILRQHDAKTLIDSLATFHVKGRPNTANKTAKAFFLVLGDGDYKVGVRSAQRMVRNLLRSTSAAETAVSDAADALIEARVQVEKCKKRLEDAKLALQASRKRARDVPDSAPVMKRRKCVL